MKTKITFFLLMLSLALDAIARPQVALVLSGGGARGFSHIGVIEVLEEHNIPVDMIVGTSMGAVMGGLYASGIPLTIIKRESQTQKWNELIENSNQRKYKYYRRKKDEEIFIIKRTFGFKDGTVALPYGIFQGQPLYQFFNRLILPTTNQHDFDKLPIRYRAIATDLVTGKPMILDKGDLPRSMLASMAVPGVFTPIAIDHHLLVDGGIGANLPIEVAKQMGADIIIAVNVTTPLFTKNQIVSVTSVAQQLTSFLTDNNVAKSKLALRPQDILITPELDDIKTADFYKIDLAIQRGRQAALEALDERKLPSKKPQIFFFTKENLNIKEVNINTNYPLNKETLNYYLDLKNQSLSQEMLSEKISYLYGLDIFENIFYSLDLNDHQHLNIEPLVDRWGPTYLQGSFVTATDFSGDSSFTVTLGTTRLLLNDLMGEWRILGRFGEQTGIFTELYQPFTPDLKWFINPSLSYQRLSSDVFINRQRLATYLVNETELKLSIGRIISNWGEMRIGIANQSGGLKNIIGSPLIDENHFHHDEAFFAMSFDTLDNIYFPRTGAKGAFSFRTYNNIFHPSTQFNQVNTQFLLALSHEKHAASTIVSYHKTLHGAPGYENQFFLGGPFQLSGFLSHTLAGNNSFLAELIYYYRAKELGINPELSIPVYLGASLEGGKVWGDIINSTSSMPTIGAGSLFAGSDTTIGPLYLVFGLTTTGNKAVHLMINRLF